jgi:hypothetical protein
MKPIVLKHFWKTAADPVSMVGKHGCYDKQGLLKICL